MFETLIAAETLSRHVHDPDWVIADCRFALADAAAGERAYAASHIPGARYFHLDRDLAGPVTSSSGRHPLPDPQLFAAKLRLAGVGANTQLVAYDDTAGAFAARFWWLSRWLGHTAVAVLDGGWKAWLAAGYPVSSEVPPSASGTFQPRLAAGVWLDTDAVLDTIEGRRTGLLLDARAPARFHGEVEPIDAVAGHVPGAVNAPYEENVAQDGRFKPPAELQARFTRLLKGRPAVEAVCMCGSGVTACHNLLAMEVAGFRGARLYAGSWSEWIRDPARPVARGET